MGWGSALNQAWNAASDAGKAAAQAIGRTYDAGKQLADQAATWADMQAREAARNAQRNLAGPVYDNLAEKAEDVRQAGVALDKTAASVKAAYAKAKQALTGKAAGSPVQSCPLKPAATLTDKDMDGWLLSPQGPNKPCLAIRPPPDKALARARARAVLSDSPCCKARQTSGPPRDIIFVNGINTTAQHDTSAEKRGSNCDALNAIAAQTCGRVVGVYNATEGFARDAAQTGQDRRLVDLAQAGKPVPIDDNRNPAVDTLSRTISNELKAGNTPEIWAHSQGGAITSLALLDAKNDRMAATMDPDPLRGMVVKSLGSAAPSWTDGPDYQHFVHVNDPVPSLFGLGHLDAGDASNAGKGAQVIRFSGTPGGGLPFTAGGKLDYIGKNIGNHDVASSYLAMEKQENGGCP